MPETTVIATYLRLCCPITGIEHDRKPSHAYLDLRWARVSQFVGFDIFVDFEDGSSQPLVTVRTDGAEDALIEAPDGNYVVRTCSVISNVQTFLSDLIDNHLLTKQIMSIDNTGVTATYSPTPWVIRGFNHDNP